MGPIMTIPREERRRLTIFFADLSGFTRLSSELDPEEVREMVNICFERLNQPIVEHGGTIHKYEGDLIMALFGYPQGHEDDPERAVLTALSMMALMPGINDRLKSRLKVPTAVGLHIGINTGLVVVGEIGSSAKMEHTVMGDAVNLASRLNDAAEDGEILVSETVYRQTEYLFDYDARPAIAVKGKAEPVRIYLPKAQRKSPGSKRGIAGLVTPMVGRDRELAIMAGALQELPADRPRLVLISGDAGLGKTRLLNEFKGRAAQDRADIVILEGICYPDKVNVPYGPFAPIIKQVLDVADDEPIPVVRERIRERGRKMGEDILPYLGMVLPVGPDDRGSDRSRYLEGKQLQQEIWRTIKNVLAGMGRPMILIIDDFHWIDPESLAFLDFLWVSRPMLPALTVLLSRPERDCPAWRTVQQWRDKSGVDLRAVELSPLDDASIRELLNACLAASGADELTRSQIKDRCAGNPLFLEEIIKSLIEREAIRPASAAIRDRGAIDIPDTLQALLTSRMDRLDPGTRDMLLASSVIGCAFDSRILEHICPTDETVFILNLAVLESAGFIRSQPMTGPSVYSFTHPLLQEAAYERLLKKQRRDLHRRIGVAAEILHADRIDEQTDFLAWHYGHGDDDRLAAAWLEKAGAKAKQNYANEEAIGYYRGLAERLKALDDPGLVLVHETLGDLAVLKGDYSKALAYYQEMAVSARQNLDRARSHRKNAEVYYRQTRYDEALKALIEAEILTRGGSPAENLELTEIDNARSWIYHLQGDTDRAVEAGQRALARIERLTSCGLDQNVILIQSKIYNNLGNIHRRRGEFEAAKSSFQTGLDLAVKIDDQRGIAVMQDNLGIIASEQGDQDQAVKYFLESKAISMRIGDIQSIAIARCNLGLAYNYLGKYDQALEEFKAYLKTSEEIGDRRCQVIAYSNQGTVHQQLAQNEAALEYFLKASRLGEEIGDKEQLTIAYFNIATIYRDQGDHDRSQGYFERSRSLAEAIGDRIGVALACAYQGEGLRRQGDLARARELIERSRAESEAFAYRPGIGIALFYLAQIEMDLGNLAAADEHLSQAEHLYDEIGDVGWRRNIAEARIRLDRLKTGSAN